MIYLDNAATTRPKPPEVGQAILSALDGFGNCGRGVHSDALTAARVVYDTREKLAALFGCRQVERVCFTANSTEALNIAIAGMFVAGDHVISTDLEHNSALRPLYRLGEADVDVDFVAADQKGQIDYHDFAHLLRPNTKGIVLNHASNLTGDVIDIARIGAFCRAHDLKLVVDASQTAGVFPIDMEAMGIDAVCFTGHKGLYGPQGTGGICVGEHVEIRPWKVGGTGVQSFSKTQPREYPARLEAGTLNSHGIAGLNAALGWLETVGMDAVRDHDCALARRFYEGIKDLENVIVYGDFSKVQRAPIVVLNIRGRDSAIVADELEERFQIATRAGAHCAPRLHKALGTEKQGAVRFSWCYFNTEAETDSAIAAVTAIAGES